MSKQSLLGLVTGFNKVIEKSFSIGLIVYCLGSSFQLKMGNIKVVPNAQLFFQTWT